MDSHQSLSHQSIPHTPKPGHTQKNVYEPVQPDERIHEMDIVRGVALFGILLANMAFFSRSEERRVGKECRYANGWS